MSTTKLLFIDDFESLKNKIKENKNLYIRLLEQCKRYEDVILPEKHPKGSSSFMGMAVANLSLLSLLTNEDRWINEAKRWICTAISYDHWGHTNLVFADINSSWMLFGLSLSYNWFSSFLTASEKEKYKKRLHTEGCRKWNYIEKHQKSGWPVNYWQNHNWLNYTGLATVAYTLKNDCPEDSIKWRDCAKENFKKIFSLMPDDGSAYEGVVYWRYGIIWLIQYAHLLKTEEGIDIFKKSNFLKNTFFYRLYQCSPIFEKNYNFGDCHDTRSGHSSAVYFKLASEYNIFEAQWMGDYVINNLLYKEAFESNVKPGILPEAFLEMIWYNPSIKKRNPKTMPKNRLFPDLGLLSCRSDWGPNAFAFSVKAGYPGGRTQWEKSWELQEKEHFIRRSLCHQHADDGAPIIWKGSNNYIIDEGYNRDVKASDHNLILFDEKGYSNEGKHNIFKKVEKNQFAFWEDVILEENYVYSIANLKQVYDKTLGVSFYKRHFFYTGDNSLIIFDEFISDSSKSIKWQIHTEDYLEENNGYFSTTDKSFKITPLIKQEVKITRKSKEIIAILNKQEPDRKTRRRMENLGFNIKCNRKKQRFLHLIESGNINMEREIKLIEDERWVGFSLKTDEKLETFLFSKGNFTKKEIKIPNFNIQSSKSFVYIKQTQDNIFTFS